MCVHFSKVGHACSLLRIGSQDWQEKEISFFMTVKHGSKMKNIPKTSSQGKQGTDNGTEARYNNLYSFGNSQALCSLIIKFYKGASYICIWQNNSFKQVPEIELSMQINPFTFLLIAQTIPHTKQVWENTQSM